MNLQVTASLPLAPPGLVGSCLSTRPSPNVPSREHRTAVRRPMNLQCRVVWRDSNETIHVANGITRDVSALGAYVQVSVGRSIPLHRLVHLQISRDARISASLPAELTTGPALAAVYRVDGSRGQGGPGYGLRLLVQTRAMEQTESRDGFEGASATA